MALCRCPRSRRKMTNQTIASEMVANLSASRSNDRITTFVPQNNLTLTPYSDIIHYYHFPTCLYSVLTYPRHLVKRQVSISSVGCQMWKLRPVSPFPFRKSPKPRYSPMSSQGIPVGHSCYVESRVNPQKKEHSIGVFTRPCLAVLVTAMCRCASGAAKTASLTSRLTEKR